MPKNIIYKKGTISVIVPIFNVDAYLDRCISSIVKQTYRNLEIILVDDGSPDNSATICDKWAEFDNRIIVIHQKNKGLSGARNSGIDFATGEFMAFVDGDDWLAPTCYEDCINRINITNSDIVAYDIFEVYGNNVVTKNHLTVDDSSYFSFDAREKFKAICNLWPMVWAKLYRSKFIDDNNMRFVDGVLYEDNPFVLGCWIRNPRVSFLNKNLHYYQMNRPGQISGGGNPRTNDIFKVLKYIQNDFNNNGADKEFLYIIKWSVGNILWLYWKTSPECKKKFYKNMKSQYISYLKLLRAGIFNFPLGCLLKMILIIMFNEKIFFTLFRGKKIFQC